MGPKKYTNMQAGDEFYSILKHLNWFKDDKASKSVGKVSIKFEKNLSIDSEEMYDTSKPQKFVLKNLRYYTVHPNMAKYYEPLKPSKQQRFLTQRKKTNNFMIKVAEFDQDMTLLLLTNNPPPCFICQQDKDGTTKYFPPDFQFKEPYQEYKPTETFSLPTMPQKKKLRPDLKPVFPMNRLVDSVSHGQQWFRFSTDNDFKTQGRYSEVYAMRKQKKMYPKLVFAPARQTEANKDVSESEAPTPAKQVVWEPLTFSKLLEVKPTRNAPGESVFRYGRAQQWVIQNATVIK